MVWWPNSQVSQRLELVSQPGSLLVVRPWTSHAPFLTRETRSQTPTSWRGSGTGDEPSQVWLGQRGFPGRKTFRAQTGTSQQTEVSHPPPPRPGLAQQEGRHYLIIHGSLALGTFLETAGLSKRSVAYNRSCSDMEKNPTSF